MMLLVKSIMMGFLFPIFVFDLSAGPFHRVGAAKRLPAETAYGKTVRKVWGRTGAHWRPCGGTGNRAAHIRPLGVGAAPGSEPHRWGFGVGAAIGRPRKQNCLLAEKPCRWCRAERAPTGAPTAVPESDLAHIELWRRGGHRPPAESKIACSRKNRAGGVGQNGRPLGAPAVAQETEPRILGLWA